MTTTALMGFTHLEENAASPEIRVNALADNAEYTVHGYVAINFASDADLTLSTSGSFPRQWQYGFIRLNDTGPVLTTARNVIVPAIAKRTVFWNNTAQDLTIKTSGGTGVTIGAGETSEVQCDGTNVISADGGGGTDNDTTYSISAETATGGVNLRLTGSDASTDDVKLAEGTGITLTRTDANTITLAASAAASVLDMPTSAKSADYTVVAGDQGYLITVDDSGATRTITLLAAATAGDGFTIAVKKMSSSNTTVIDGNGAETIDGATTYTLSSQYDTVFIQCDGSNWNVLTEPASGATDANAIHDNVAGEIVAVSNQTPHPADSILGEDDSNSDAKASFTIQQVRAATVYNLTGTDIDPANGDYQYKTLSANTTFTESLASGEGVTLRLSGGGTYTVTWPTMSWVGGTAPTLTADDVVVVWQEQTTVYGLYVGSLA